MRAWSICERERRRFDGRRDRDCVLDLRVVLARRLALGLTASVAGRSAGRSGLGGITSRGAVAWRCSVALSFAIRAAASASVFAGLILNALPRRSAAGRTAHSRCVICDWSSVPAGRCGSYAVFGVFGTRMMAIALPETEFRRIGAHVVEVQQVEERLRRLLARRAVVVAAQKERGGGRRNRGVLEDAIVADDRAAAHPG